MLQCVGLILCYTFLFHFVSAAQDTTAKKPQSARDTLPPVRPAARDTVPARDTLPSDTSGRKIKVTGMVSLGSVDPSGSSVEVKGTGHTIPTDSTGHYVIKAPPYSVLIFSHIGYQTLEESVNGRTSIDVRLGREANTLQQVTVSYGKLLKRDITGAVSKVSGAAVQDVTASEFGQKLQGQVAGLEVQQTSGIPGQAIVFQVRGAASLHSGNQPLIVVDGQPINNDVADGTGDLNLISPDEIESYSVLKDAAASSLYGSRASNGVILITTKTAKIGQTSVSANVYYGVQTVPMRGRPDLMDAREFATFMNGFYQDKITYEGYINPTTGTATIPADYANPAQYGKGTDWYRSLLRTAPMENYSVNMSFGTGKVSSSTTMNYFNQQGVLYNTGMQRYAFRSNNEYRPIDRIKIGLNLAPSYQIDHNTRGGALALNGNRQVVAGADLSSPLIAPYASRGIWNLSTSSFGMYALPNYLQQEKIMDNNQTDFSFLGNAYLDVEIIPGLHVRTTINGDILTQDYNAYYGTMFGQFGAPPPRPPASSTANNYSNNTYSWLNENTLDWNAKFGNHSLDVLAGYTAQKWSV